MYPSFLLMMLLGIQARRLYLLLAMSCWWAAELPTSVHSYTKGHGTKRSKPPIIWKYSTNALESYLAWCVCVVSTSLASITCSLGLVVLCKTVGATHIHAKCYGATHNRCAIQGTLPPQAKLAVACAHYGGV